MQQPVKPNNAVTWRGSAMAIAVGIAFAANTALAGVAYTGGATPLAVLLSRTLAALIVLSLLLHRQQINPRLPARKTWQALGIGAIFASYAFCILAAIQYLPLGVVVATFYTFPLIIAAYQWGSGHEPFKWRTALALAVAFIGILLALDVGGQHLNRIGVVLCIVGALSVSAVIILSTRVRGEGDSRPITLHMLAAALVIFLLAEFVSGSAALPRTGFAWFGFVAGPIFYAFAVITLFVVNAEIGPVKASMLMNIEPVASVLFGFVLLGQHLTAVQLAGIAVVITTVLTLEYLNQRELSAQE